MATHRWTGDQPAVAQVVTFTLTGLAVSDVITLTCGGESVVYTTGTDVEATEATALAVAWNASTFGAHMEVTAAGVGDTLVLTADTAGVPFTVTATIVGTGTLPYVHTTGNAGPNVWNSSNFDSDAWPTSADTVILENSAVAILYGLSPEVVAYTGGGTAELIVGDVITGVTSAAIAEVMGVTLASGTWAGGDAAGNIYLSGRVGTFQSENLNTPLQANLATIGGASAVVDLAERRVRKTFTGVTGLPERNANGYDEYRGTYLAMGAAIDDVDASGSGRIKHDYLTEQTASTIRGSGVAAESNVPVVLLKGSNASSTLNSIKGVIGVAWFAGETAQFATIDTSYLTSRATDAQVDCGVGLTLAALTIDGGIVTCRNSVATIVQNAGTCTLLEAAASGTSTKLYGGIFYHSSSGTFASLIINDGATFDGSQVNTAATLTAVEMHAGARYRDPHQRFTLPGGIDLPDSGIEGVIIERGNNYTVQFTAI